MRSSLFLMVAGLLAGCVDITPCRNADPELWCFHDWDAMGPVDDGSGKTCNTPTPPVDAELACGYLVVGRADLNGAMHFYDAQTLDHVATKVFRDVNMGQCGTEYWYGEHLDC